MGTTPIEIIPEASITDPHKMQKIVSFGDSFIFGSEIANNLDGSQGWPGLAAKKLDVSFQCCAIRGSGNGQIFKQILQYFSANVKSDTLAVVNWTWIARFDLMDRAQIADITLGPTCMPELLRPDPDSESALAALEFYQYHVDRHPNFSLLNSLLYISAAMEFLEHNAIPCIHTYMDHALAQSNWYGTMLSFYAGYRLPDWPIMATHEDMDRLPPNIQQEVQENYNQGQIPLHIKSMQNMIQPRLENFDDLNFLEWSELHGFEITPSPNLHPLLPAHQAAAEFWLPRYERIMS
jgi:hypothetical protein